MPGTPTSSTQDRPVTAGAARLYLRIAVPTPLRRIFHYLVPAGLAASALVPGIRVRVPFGRQTLTGILLGVTDQADVDEQKLKAPRAILDTAPVFPASLLKLLNWAANYYHHPIGEVMATALPVLLRQGESVLAEIEVLEATPAGEALELSTLKRAPAQLALLRRLRADPAGLGKSQLRDLGIGGAVVAGLLDKSLARWHTRTVTGDAFQYAAPEADGRIDLTPAQETAVESILAAGNKTSLLYGITGSGKTEVYFELIEDALQRGQQALVLVPEIGLTPQTVRRFKSRFNVPIFVFHSGMTDRERLVTWAAAHTGSAGIIIGTRSAVFIPLRQPGLIVVDEEHDSSFKQQDGFRYSARDLAVMRGQLETVPVILGSATPSLESWHNVATGKYHRATLTSRPGLAKPARYKVVDIRNLPLIEGFAQGLLDDMKQTLEAGNQVLVFQNRRGFSPVLLCHCCGWIAHCNRCDARMTVHQQSGALICHHCGSQARMPRQCPDCGEKEFALLGIGTQRIESAFNSLFSEYPTIRIDRDSTRSRHAMDRFMTEIAKGEPAILVGTQLLAKGHHFPDVTLVAIVDMDAGFYSANYKAAERMGQLILQVGGRAGRAEKPGVVVIQTHLPEQPIFRQLISEGYESFADRLLEERSAHELPPYHHHALIRAEASKRELPMEFLGRLAESIQPGASVAVLGPVPASMERKAGKYRAHLLISCKSRPPLKIALDQLIEQAELSELSRKVRWSIDVDPVDLF